MGQDVFDHLGVIGSIGNALQHVSVQRLEHLVQGVGRHAARPSPEQVRVNRPQHRGDRIVVDVALGSVLEQVEKVGSGDRRVEDPDGLEGGIDALHACIWVNAGFVMLRIVQKLFEQGLRVEAEHSAVGIVELLSCIRPKRRIHLLDSGGLRLHSRKVEADVVAHLVVGVAFDRIPIIVVVNLLKFWVEIHEDEVSDLVGLGKVESRRVQALEDQLGIVFGVEGDVDNAKGLDSFVELVGGDVHLFDAVEKVQVVLGHVRALDICVVLAVENGPERLAVVLH